MAAISNEIYIGSLTAPTAKFTHAEIESASGEVGVDLVSDELTIDRLDASIKKYFALRLRLKPTDYSGLRTSDGYILAAKNQVANNWGKTIPYGAPLWYYHGGKLKGKFYVDSVERVGWDAWSVRAMSLIGLFDTQKHYGGVYSGKPFAELIAEIFGGTVGAASGGLIPITGGVESCYVAADLAEVKIHNYLPYATKRENLHQLLFANGASLTRDADANIVFKFLENLTAAEIEDGRIFMGGSVSYKTLATGVEVTEHTYQWVYNEEPREVYNNTDAYAEAAENMLVVFSQPVKVDTLTTEGDLTVSECGENYAIVSGKGILRGVPYVHLTRTISKSNNSSAPENIKRVSDVTLISPLNSENVLKRLYAYYVNAQTVNASIINEDEKPGQKFSLSDPFKERFTGVLSKMSYNATSFIKGNCEFVTDYEPQAFGNNYNNSALLTGSGTWTVPASVRNSNFPYIRITLVGGGSGGQGGHGGMQGRGMWPIGGLEVAGRGSGKGGKGGKGGIAGQGGKVISIAKLDVRNINYIKFTCGIGGAAGTGGPGGVRDTDEDHTLPGEGGVGGETKIELYNDNGVLVDTYTTANGVVLPSGVANLATGEVYGLSGVDGQRAGDGGEGGTASASADGGNGEDITVNGVTYPGGKGSEAVYAEHYAGAIGTMVAECGGGGGSGAAYGTPGNDSPQPALAQWQQRCEGGYGGHGVSAAFIPITATTYGQGGDGGHGGSGGGSGGAQNNTPVQHRMCDGEPGDGGDGTIGAAGAPGCIFMYFGGAA